MFAHGIALHLLITVVTASYPTLRDLVNPQEQYALRDTLSTLVEFEYKDNVIGSLTILFIRHLIAWKLVSRSHLSGSTCMRVARLLAIVSFGSRDILFQGDIRMPTSLLAHMVSSANTRRKRTAFRNRQYPGTIWKTGVPFAFHKSLSMFICYSPGMMKAVGVQWGEPAWQRQQIVSIGPGCEPFGISSHEVAHALGMFHEQSRFDRDNWVNVYPNRVPRSLLYNFAKVSFYS
ncbi:astacin [Ostertagia ostertagi]